MRGVSTKADEGGDHLARKMAHMFDHDARKAMKKMGITNPGI